MSLRLRARGTASRRSARKLGAALVYHGISPSTAQPASQLVSSVPTAVFEQQLDTLRASYDIVPPTRLLEAVSRRRRGQRFPVAITFDDDLPAHVEVAAPALRRAGLPAAFFLCGKSLGDPGRFWWEDLATLAAEQRLPSTDRWLPEATLGHSPPTPSVVQALASMIERLPPRRRDVVAAELGELAGPARRGLTASEIRALAEDGFEIGFHTRRHYLLSTLTEPELAVAMTDGRASLEEIVGHRLTMIAYPHGKADRRIGAAAQAAGYEIGFTSFAMPIGPVADPLLLGRIEMAAVRAGEVDTALGMTLARSPAAADK